MEIAEHISYKKQCNSTIFCTNYTFVSNVEISLEFVGIGISFGA